MKKLLPIICFCLLGLFQIRASDYSQADKYSLELNNNYPSTRDLADIISETEFSDQDKLKVLFNWITINIFLEIDKSENIFTPTPIPENILDEGRAGRLGMVVLFDSVCHHLGIESYIVKGYMKEDKNPVLSNHFWNAVNVNDEWHFIDVVLGSGTFRRVEKSNVFALILGKPAIKNKVIYRRERNDACFFADKEILSKTHLPADPMWQLSDNPMSMACFYSNDINCEQSPSYFNYHDSIHRFMTGKPAYKEIVSGQNALKYNYLNYYDLAAAHIKKGFDHFDKSEMYVQESISYKKKELDEALYHLKMGSELLETGRVKADSVYRAGLSDFKIKYKDAGRSIKNYNKIVTKTIKKNLKYIDKTTGDKTKLKELLGKNYMSAYDIIRDEKIYLIDRPDNIPDYRDSLIFMGAKMRFDTLFQKLLAEADTLQLFLSQDFTGLFDSLKYLRSELPDVIVSIDSFSISLKKIFANNDPETFLIADTVFSIADPYYETLSSYHDIMENIVKRDIKEGHTLIKAKIKSLETLGKESKNLLITIKKNMIVNQHEEENYDSINQILYMNYLSYIDKMEEQKDYFRSEKGIIKLEKNHLKDHIKKLGKVNSFIMSYYNYNYDRMKKEYANDKTEIKNISKQVSTRIKQCEKLLGD